MARALPHQTGACGGQRARCGVPNPPAGRRPIGLPQPRCRDGPDPGSAALRTEAASAAREQCRKGAKPHRPPGRDEHTRDSRGCSSRHRRRRRRRRRRGSAHPRGPVEVGDDVGPAQVVGGDALDDQRGRDAHAGAELVRLVGGQGVARLGGPDGGEALAEGLLGAGGQAAAVLREEGRLVRERVGGVRARLQGGGEPGAVVPSGPLHAGAAVVLEAPDIQHVVVHVTEPRRRVARPLPPPGHWRARRRAAVLAPVFAVPGVRAVGGGVFGLFPWGVAHRVPVAVAPAIAALEVAAGAGGGDEGSELVKLGVGHGKLSTEDRLDGGRVAGAPDLRARPKDEVGCEL